MPKTGYHSTLKIKPFIFSYRTVKIEAWQVETKRLEQKVAETHLKPLGNAYTGLIRKHCWRGFLTSPSDC